MEKNKKYLVIAIAVLLVVIGSGITFAYFAASTKATGTGSTTEGNTVTVEDTTVNVEGKIEFNDLDIYPGHKNISKISVTATGDRSVIYNLIWTGTNTLNTPLKYYVYKTTTDETPQISCTKNKEVAGVATYYYETCTESNFDNLGEVIGSGQISNTSESTVVKLLRNESLQATEEGATVYYYVVLEYPNEEGNQNIDIGGSFDGEVSIQILNEPELLLLSEAIEEAYQNNPTMLAYDETVDNNLRYIGANPNNYVLFNDELWRIIGVMNSVETASGTTESLVKLIRNDSIGEYSWDNKPSGTGSSTSRYGSNDWSDSALQIVLNEGAYWNRTSGTCPIGQNGATTNCDFSNTGLTKRAKAMIETVTWKLGGNSTYNDVTASMFYERERGTTVYSGHATEWVGEVGLMYPSDYGYATSGGSTTDRATCLATELYNWMSSTGFSDCYNNDWLYNGSLQWTLTPRSSHSNYVFFVYSNGNLNNDYAFYGNGARPSVYLKSNISISGGTGTSTDPYTLSVG